MSEKTPSTNVNLKSNGLLWSYIIFSLPGFFSGLVWLLVAVIVLAGVSAGVAATKKTGDTEKELLLTATTEGKSKNGILVYSLNGPISTTGSSSTTKDNIYTDKVAKDFKLIRDNKDIKNVVFKINTPGGSVFASKVLGDQINNLISSKGQSQAVYYFDQIVASGGLLATYKTNNYVVGSQYGETGSIGVILTLPNLKGTAEKIGYSETVIKSAPSKDYGNPLRDLSPDEQKFLQGQVDTEYNGFVDTVASGRKLSRDKVATIANGFVYDNKIAKEYGLFDEIGDIQKSVEKAASNAGLGSDYSVYETTTQPTIFESLFQSSGVHNLLGLPTNAVDKLNKATSLQSGTLYMIDTNRI
jgi:protease IV